MNNRTPTPWRARDDGDGAWSIVFDDDEFFGADAWNIASVDNYVLGEDVAGANARLIAAAPDMLAALKHAEEAVIRLHDGSALDASMIVPIRLAIAKAEGRS